MPFSPQATMSSQDDKIHRPVAFYVTCAIFLVHEVSISGASQIRTQEKTGDREHMHLGQRLDQDIS